MKQLKACIFDLDGTMIDSERVTRAAYRVAFAQYGCHFTDGMYESILCGGPGNRAKLRGYFPDVDVDAVCRDAAEWKKKQYEQYGVPVKKGLYELLDVLEEKGIVCIIATMTKRKTATDILEKLHLEDRFQYQVFGDEVERGKPEPDIFLRALELSCITAGETVVLEDSYNGILAANSAGIPVIMIPDLLSPRPDLKTEAVLEDLTQVISFLDE